MVSGAGSTPEPELCGEARLCGVEAPKGTEEPMVRGPTDQGVWVIGVPDVDTEEVGESDGRSLRDGNAPLGDLAEEMGRGRQGLASSGSQGGGGHGVQHTHGCVGRGLATGKAVHRAVALGDEHSEGVVGRQPGGSERSVCGPGAKE